ncbi:hypothetical protein HDU96_000339 [Phlyctochytrium bullatum]|nr:hypothetical protein HDU96_000339 [Phlyctochytrium bullatum]
MDMKDDGAETRHRGNGRVNVKDNGGKTVARGGGGRKQQRRWQRKRKQLRAAMESEVVFGLDAKETAEAAVGCKKGDGGDEGGGGGEQELQWRRGWVGGEVDVLRVVAMGRRWRCCRRHWGG